MRNRVCTTIGMPSCTALLAAALVPAMALAQGTPAAAADDTVLAEIIVTVRKRQERAIDVPASLNVFSGDSLEAAGVKKYRKDKAPPRPKPALPSPAFRAPGG